MTDLRSEDQILNIIDAVFPRAAEGFCVGRGDDCAVWRPNGPVCVSTDLFMEDVHFRRRYFSPQDTGWKALAVNFSDLAAMGARPVGFSLGLALPPDADAVFVQELFQGMADLIAATPMDGAVPVLSGGDISRAEKLHLCVTVFGETDNEAPLLRGGCQPGDGLFLVGRLGLARLGLKVLEGDGLEAMPDYPDACAALLRPIPRIREGLRLRALRQRFHDSGAGAGRMGLMDVSDGLARDLPRLLGHSTSAPALFGADIRLPSPHAEQRRFAACYGDSDAVSSGILRETVLGGDDYALLGFCEPALAAQLMVTLPEATFLGHITSDPCLLCDGLPISGGFDHFARA